ncbi:hypothetical protein ACEWET_05875 [Paraliobacillus sp. JSM ZJ581]
MIVVYWFLWIYWVIVTFLMEKGKKRNNIACFMLLLITCSSFNLRWFGITVNLSVIFLFIVSNILLVLARRKLFLFLACLFIAHAYAALQLWDITNPVWVFAPKIIIFSLILAFLVLFITSNMVERFIIACTSIIIGEIVYSLVVYRLEWDVTIGDTFMFLLLCSLTCTILLYHFFLEIKIKLQDILHMLEQQNKRWTNE